MHVDLATWHAIWQQDGAADPFAHYVLRGLDALSNSKYARWPVGNLG